MAKREAKTTVAVALQTDKLLGLDGVSDSPLPEYPGTLRMPLVMTLAMHKRWQAQVNAAAAERGPDDLRVGIAFAAADESSSGERLPFLYDDVKLGMMFGALDVRDGRGNRWTSDAEVDELPLPIATWVAKVYREWEDSQLLFRWDSSAGLAAQDGNN